MLNGTKNIFLTALMVVGATVATAVAIVLVPMLLAASSSAPVELLLGGLIACLMAVVAGAFFSVVSLVVAAVTMPPAIALMRQFKLPRPLFDILGGGVAGLLSAGAVADMLDSIASAKGGNLGGAEMLVLYGMVGGGVLGYMRHAMLVRKHEGSPAPQFA
jgi:hypothetical protein